MKECNLLLDTAELRSCLREIEPIVSVACWIRAEEDQSSAIGEAVKDGTIRTAMTTWFCDAYASWQKGGVQNANGRLRRWLPRQIDIDKVSDEEIQDIILTARSHAEKMPRFQDAIPGNPQRAWQKTSKFSFHKPVAPGSRIDAFLT